MVTKQEQKGRKEILTAAFDMMSRQFLLVGKKT